MNMNVVCYEIDGLCYYVTKAQNKILLRDRSEPDPAAIKKTAFTTGLLGEPIKSPDGLGAEAVILPEGAELEEEGEDEVEEPKAPAVETLEDPKVEEHEMGDPEGLEDSEEDDPEAPVEPRPDPLRV